MWIEKAPSLNQGNARIWDKFLSQSFVSVFTLAQVFELYRHICIYTKWYFSLSLKLSLSLPSSLVLRRPPPGGELGVILQNCKKVAKQSSPTALLPTQVSLQMINIALLTQLLIARPLRQTNDFILARICVSVSHNCSTILYCPNFSSILDCCSSHNDQMIQIDGLKS